MRTDLCSVTQNNRRRISYMSVSMGLMADLDINTEHLRWMGDTRFIYGFLRGSAFAHLVHSSRLTSPPHFAVIRQRPCPIKISLKVSERDKLKMHESYQSVWHKQDEDRKTCWDDLDLSEKLPPLKHSETDTDGWEDFDIPVLYFYGGLLPYVGQYVTLPTFISGLLPPSSPSVRDLLQWPLVLPNDGLIDIAVQEMASASSLVGQMGIAPRGGQYWTKEVRRYSVRLKWATTDSTLCLPLVYPRIVYSNTTSKSTRTASRPTTLEFSQLTAKIPPAPISKWRYIRGWARF